MIQIKTIKNLLLFLLGFVLISSASSREVEQIMINGKIFTAVENQPLQQAIAISQDRIIRVGSNEEIKALASKNTLVIDLNNRFVMPGLIDSHLHPIMGGIESVTANMKDQYVDTQTLAKKLKEAQKDGTAKAGDTLVMQGVSSEHWSHLEDLDAMFNQGEWVTVPIAFVGSDHHTSWANNVLLARAGVTAAFIQSLPKAEQQNIGHDKAFKPNGFLVDSGWDKVSEAIPELDDALMYQGGIAGIKYLNSYGITGWLDATVNALPNRGIFNIKNTDKTTGLLPLYRKLSRNGDLTVHAAGLHVINSKSGIETLDILEKINQQYRDVNNLKMIGVKVFADGVIEYPAQSSALMGEYSNNQSRGELLFDPDQFKRLVNAADAKGMVVHIHAIGDRAVNESLNAFELARANRQSGLPHTITHLQLVHEKDYNRFDKLGVIASMQLLWAYPDPYIIEMVKPYISAESFEGMYPARSLFNHGATIAGASDYPVSGASPFLAMYVGMTRVGELGVLNANETLERDTLLKAYTINSAKALRWEKEIGSLEPGKKADLIMLDRDVLTVTPEEFAETKVLWTMFEGKIVYRAK